MSEWKETEIIPRVPSIWKEYTLNQIGEFKNGVNFSASSFGLGYPVVNVKHLYKNRYAQINGLDEIKIDTIKKIEDYELKRGDILFARSSVTLEGTGQVVIVNELPAKKTVYSGFIIRLRCSNNKIDTSFLSYLLRTKFYKEHFINIAAGTSIINLSQDTLKKISVFLPPLPEQKSISALLSCLDDKIDLLHRQNATLEKMAETLFRKWFVEDVKDDWEEVKLGQLVTITSSKRIFYSEYVSFGIPFYRSKEIIELHDTGSTNSDLFITNDRFQQIYDKFGAPIEGDILLTSVGTLGIPYKVKKADKFYFKDGNLTWFKDFKRVSSNIIYCWLKSKIGKEQLDGIAIGSTQPALTISGMKDISMLIPPHKVIIQLDNQLKNIYLKIEINQTQIRTLTKLRDTLLPKLMSGEVRVEM